MTNHLKIIIRTIVVLICLGVIIYFQREVSKANLMWMLVGLAGILAVIAEYNYSFNHPEIHNDDKD